MPIYEYACEKCGNHIEVLQKVGDAPPKKCSKCKKGRMEKMISRTSFQLKGGGWYASDYAKPASKGKAETKAEGKTETKSESKSEKKTESKSEKPAKDSKTVSAV
jgi:putative FmdB family regulatory protein